MKKIYILFLGLIFLSGCLGQQSLYLRNKELIDATNWKECVKLPGNFGGPSTGKKMDLMTALHLADKAGCFNGKRITNIDCGLTWGAWSFSVEAKTPIDSTDISGCSVYVETDEVKIHTFGTAALVNPDKVPEINIYPSERPKNEPEYLEVR